jgi:hypothetical protein
VDPTGHAFVFNISSLAQDFDGTSSDITHQELQKMNAHADRGAAQRLSRAANDCNISQSKVGVFSHL